MSISQKRAEELHSRGEQDRSNDKPSSRPHGIKSELTTWSKYGCEKNRKENEIYKAGYDNTDYQLDNS